MVSGLVLDIKSKCEGFCVVSFVVFTPYLPRNAATRLQSSSHSKRNHDQARGKRQAMLSQSRTKFAPVVAPPAKARLPKVGT